MTDSKQLSLKIYEVSNINPKTLPEKRPFKTIFPKRFDTAAKNSKVFKGC